MDGLTELWRSELPGQCTITAAPFVNDELVAVRCGDACVALDARSGDLRWRTEVQPGSWMNTYFTADRRSMVTVQTARDGNWTLVGLSWDGTIRWGVELGAAVQTRGLSLVAGRLLVLTLKHHKFDKLWSIDPTTGHVDYTRQMGWDADGVVDFHGEPLFWTRFAGGEQPGLYLLRGESEHIPIERRSVMAVAQSEETLAAIVESDQLVAFGAKDLEPRWSATASGEALAVGRSMVAHLVSDPAGHRVVVRDELTGHVLWRGTPAEEKPVRLQFAGQVLLAIETLALNAYLGATGRPLFHSEASYSLGCAVAGPRLYFGSDDAVVCFGVTVDGT